MSPLTSRRRSSSFASRTGLIAGFLLFIGLAAIMAAFFFGQERMAITGAITFVLLALALVDIRLTILGVFAFLVVLGDLRRLLIPVAGWSGTDPLLLIAPGISVILLGHLLATQRLNLRSLLSRWMLLFTGVMFLQIFNPVQGGLAVGIAGAIFLIVPTFWFWIGQAYGTPALARTLFYYLLVPLSIPAVAMGFIQLFNGYLPYQKEWYRIAGYAAIGTDINSLRPISLFVNITEYLIFLSIVVVLLTAALMHKKAARSFKLTALVLIPVCTASILLAGSRGPVVMSITVIALLWALRGKTIRAWVPRLALALLLGGGGLVWGLTHAGNVESQNEQIADNLARQADLVETGGTTGIHLELAWQGIRYGIENPLGGGIGSITRAATKFGGTKLSSEVDITNMFMATGVGGGIIYLVLIIIAATSAIRYWHRERSLIAYGIVGVLAVTGMAWLSAGNYLITPLVWLVIGILDRLQSETSSDASSNAPSEAEVESAPQSVSAAA